MFRRDEGPMEGCCLRSQLSRTGSVKHRGGQYNGSLSRDFQTALQAEPMADGHAPVRGASLRYLHYIPLRFRPGRSSTGQRAYSFRLRCPLAWE